MAKVKATDWRGFNLAWGSIFLFHTIEFKGTRFNLFDAVQVETNSGELFEGAITAISLNKFELDYSTVLRFSDIRDIQEVKEIAN